MELFAEYADRTTIREEHVHYHAKCGRLARAVWPDEAVDAALWHRQRQVVDRNRFAECLGDIFDFDSVHYLAPDAS